MALMKLIKSFLLKGYLLYGIYRGMRALSFFAVKLLDFIKKIT
jgi:hypothetical protein